MKYAEIIEKFIIHNKDNVDIVSIKNIIESTIFINLKNHFRKTGHNDLIIRKTKNKMKDDIYEVGLIVIPREDFYVFLQLMESTVKRINSGNYEDTMHYNIAMEFRKIIKIIRKWE